MPNDEELIEQNEQLENNTSNNEPAVEEPASVGSEIEEQAQSAVQATKNATTEKAKSEIKKKVLSFLLKNPYVLLIIGIIAIVFLVIILIFGLDFDLAGTGNVRPDLYSHPCNQIYLTWEKSEYIEEHTEDGDYVAATDPALVDLTDTDRYEYKEYSYDSYVSGIILPFNSLINDVNNETVYEMMAIAARSRVVSKLPNNCVILRDYNPDTFVELTGSEEKYTEITNAVSKSAGMIIGRNNVIIDAQYDGLDYISKYKEDNTNYNDKGSYYLKNKNEQGYQVVPASWIVENKVPIRKVISSTYLESMSAYGAKYLLEKVDSQYDLYITLEYYYGRDIEYYTIDYAFSNSYSNDCSDISMKNTTLTKEEFVARVNTITDPGAKPLIDIAETIYDMGVSNGVNPELVFIRAKVEGYSPGSSKNNYWGIDCTNTGGEAACASYSSITEGVAGFLKIMTKYNVLTDLTGKYAYLGAYWYNPGGSGLGGCYYAEHIYDQIPERVANACAEGNICNADGSGNCVSTTEEDYHAYAVYQSQSMIKARKTIFGLDQDGCAGATQMGEPGSGSCTIWKQGDSRWGSISLGSSSTNMSKSGCAVTSIAIAMSCSGTTINNVASFNPGTLVNQMNSSNAFTSSGAITWGTSAIPYFAPSFTFAYGKKITGTDVEKLQTVSDTTKENSGKVAVLLHFKNDAHPRGHWVVLKSADQNKFTVYDPAGNEPDVNTYEAKHLDDMRVYKY